MQKIELNKDQLIADRRESMVLDGLNALRAKYPNDLIFSNSGFAIGVVRCVIDAVFLSFTEENCRGHVASSKDPKTCGRCGVHIDSLRPDEDDPVTRPHRSQT